MSKPRCRMVDGEWVCSGAIVDSGWGARATGRGATAGDAYRDFYLKAWVMLRGKEQERREARTREEELTKMVDDEASRAEWAFALAWVALVAYCVYEAVC